MSGWLKYLWFLNDMTTPKSMWVTPKMMDNFILNELRNTILFSDTCQMGSMPKG